MTNICSNIANVVTCWVERNAPYLINTMANFTCSLVRVGCNLTRKAAVVADDFINTTLGKTKVRF